MKTRTYFSAVMATVLMAISPTSAVGQHAGKIEFVGSIVHQGCGTAKHTYRAYSGHEKINFDLQLNDCLDEIQSVVSVSIDALDKKGGKLAVVLNPQSAVVDVVVSPIAANYGVQQAQTPIYLGGEGLITPLQIKYRDTAGPLNSNTDKVYVIVNLGYV